MAEKNLLIKKMRVKFSTGIIKGDNLEIKLGKYTGKETEIHIDGKLVHGARKLILTSGVGETNKLVLEVFPWEFKIE